MSLSEGYKLSFYLQMFSYVLPIWFGFKYFKYFDRILQIFFLSIIISFMIDTYSWILVKFKIQNHYLDYLFSFNNFITKVLIYSLLIKIKTHRNVIIGLGISIIPLFIIDLIWIAGAKHHNAFSASIANIWIFISTLYCLRQLINEVSSDFSKNPMFWILIGISIKKVLTFADSLFSDYVLSYSVTLAYILYSFTYLVSVVENLLYSRGFYESKK